MLQSLNCGPLFGSQRSIILHAVAALIRPFWVLYCMYECWLRFYAKTYPLLLWILFILSLKPTPLLPLMDACIERSPSSSLRDGCSSSKKSITLSISVTIMRKPRISSTTGSECRQHYCLILNCLFLRILHYIRADLIGFAQA